jgi:hypothetical protein
VGGWEGSGAGGQLDEFILTLEYPQLAILFDNLIFSQFEVLSPFRSYFPYYFHNSILSSKLVRLGLGILGNDAA